MEQSRVNKTLKEIKSLIFVVMLALSIRILIIEPFFIPTGSMFPTILEQDYIFSTKYSYGYSKYSLPFHFNIFSGRILKSNPQRGDIIIFQTPHDSKKYIKRLIGLPGEKVQLINDIVYINDQPINRQSAGIYIDDKHNVYDRYIETLSNGVSYYIIQMPDNNNFIDKIYSNTEVFYIPEGKYFFLGDNRDGSSDSRGNLGLVPEENFIAKGQFIYFSTKSLFWNSNFSFISQVKQVYAWILSIRWNRIFMNLYDKPSSV